MKQPPDREPEDHALLRRNRLLALLDERTLAALAPALEHVPMKLRERVMSQGRPVRHAWFPTDGVISMLADLQPGRQPIEVGTVGNEGMTGLPLLLGRGIGTGECFVQVPGHAWRMPAADFQAAVREHPSFTQVLQRFTQALLVQTSQGTACNRAHSPLERCARWLLMTDDRLESDTLPLTQEFLAHMLGERRPTVSRAAAALQARRLIAYTRGRITVLDRKGLEEMSCPCYRVIRNEYDAMLRNR